MKSSEFGISLSKIRLAKNISAYELSLRIGKSPNYIHQIENGKINIGLKSILDICEALEIKPKELFDNVG